MTIIMQSKNQCDFLIIGGGIVGLSIARELTRKFPDAAIILLEKESELGLHASGRNSGVLHTGIYYPPDTMKARFCAEGARALGAFCDAEELPIKRVGKVILPLRHDDKSALQHLQVRAEKNGAKAPRDFEPRPPARR